MDPVHIVRQGILAGAWSPEEVSGVGDNLERGLALQLKVLDSFAADGDGPGGWKVGHTSRGARDSMGVGFRPFGFIRESQVFPSDTELDAQRLSGCSVEPELCWELAAPLYGSHVSPEEARSAVKGVAASFEIVQLRLPPATPNGLQLADDLKQWGLVVGERRPVSGSPEVPRIQFRRDGETLYDGPPESIDDHYLSLSRICATLARFGRGLDAGQLIITGSLLAPQPVAAAATFGAVLEGIGEVSLRVRH